MKKFTTAISVLLSAFMLANVVSASDYPGIDVSVWQGSVNFSEVKTDGIEYVYIRAGYGTSEDTMFRKNAYAAAEAGLNVGFYFFVTAQNADEARTQAEYFAEIISDESYNCRPAVDFETFTGLSNEECNGIALAFSETLQEKTGYVPLFYTDVSSAEELWDESLTAYPLWIANYGVSEPSSTGIWDSWAGFQYSDVGSISGISVDVDLDRFTDEVLLSVDRLPFDDVSADDWYYAAVLSLYQKGLIFGVDDTSFAPDEFAMRAMPVTILYRLDGLPDVSYTAFSDVSPGLWYSDSVYWAAENGIAEGTGSDMFYPAEPVSRQDAVVFIYRYALYRDYDTENKSGLGAFTDAELVSDYALDAMEWAVGTGIVRGTDEDTLSPDTFATRAEIAVMLARFIAIY